MMQGFYIGYNFFVNFHFYETSKMSGTRIFLTQRSALFKKLRILIVLQACFFFLPDYTSVSNADNAEKIKERISFWIVLVAIQWLS